MSVRSHGTGNHRQREHAQFSNSRRVSFWRASMDTRDCRLLIASGGEQRCRVVVVEVEVAVEECGSDVVVRLAAHATGPVVRFLA